MTAPWPWVRRPGDADPGGARRRSGRNGGRLVVRHGVGARARRVGCRGPSAGRGGRFRRSPHRDSLVLRRPLRHGDRRLPHRGTERCGCKRTTAPGFSLSALPAMPSGSPGGCGRGSIGRCRIDTGARWRRPPRVWCSPSWSPVCSRGLSIWPCWWVPSPCWRSRSAGTWSGCGDTGPPVPPTPPAGGGATGCGRAPDAEARDRPRRSYLSRRRPRSRTRRVLGVTSTVLAFCLVWVALTAPDAPGQGASALLRIPVEGLVLVAIALMVPPRAGRVIAVAAGIVLAVLTLLKVLDLGFGVALDRPFDPVTDWAYFGPAFGVLGDSVGHAAAVAVVVAAALLVIALLALLPLSTDGWRLSPAAMGSGPPGPLPRSGWCGSAPRFWDSRSPRALRWPQPAPGACLQPGKGDQR